MPFEFRRYSDAKVWRGPVASAHSVRAGSCVVYHGIAAHQLRGFSDPRRVLRIDSKYEVAGTSIRGCHHGICLVGHDGVFPAQGFHAAAAHGWVEA